MKKILVYSMIFSFFILSACSQENKGEIKENKVHIPGKQNLNIDKQNNSLLNKNLETVQNNIDNGKNSKYIENKSADEKYKKLVEEMREKMEKGEEEKEEAMEKIDLSYCKKKYKDKEFIDKCKLDIVFSKYNKKGCVLVKNEKKLYNKCLEIKKGIQEWRKIRKYKYYYEEYGENN